MARKKILPRKLGPLKIPKALRRMGDKALADPEVVAILSGALASVGVALAARKVARDAPDGTALARSAASSRALGSVTDLVRQALEDAVRTRHPAPPGEEAPAPRARRRKAKAAVNADTDEEAPADHLH